MIRSYLLILVILITASVKASAGVQGDQPVRLSLTEAMRLVSLQNAQLLAADQRVRQAVSDIAISRSDLMPQLTGVFGGKRQTTDLRASGIALPGDPQVGPFNSFDTRLRVSMDLLDLESIERLKQTKAKERLAQAQYDKIRQDILLLTAAVFLEAQRADQAVGLNKVQLRQKEEEHRLAEVELKQGIGSLTAVKEAKMGLEDARYRLLSAKALYQETRTNLNVLLGLAPDRRIIFEEDNSWSNKPLTQGGAGVDVIVSQEQVNVSKAAVSQVRSGFLPKLTLSGDYGRLGESPSDSSRTYTLGLALSMPIWEGGLRQARLRKARQELAENEMLLKDAFNQHQARIRQAGTRLKEAQAFLHARTAQLDYARHQLLLVQGRFQSGSASRLDVLKAETMNALSLDGRNEAQALYRTARIKLAAVMGRLEGLFDIKQRGNER